MTAPDPGLTDLIAEHICVEPLRCGCGFYVQSTKEWAKHLALVVDQHPNGQAAKLAEAVQGMWRLIRKLDETSDGLGDWHDATEYIDWARKEVQEIYVRVALEGEQ